MMRKIVPFASVVPTLRSPSSAEPSLLAGKPSVVQMLTAVAPGLPDAACLQTSSIFTIARPFASWPVITRLTFSAMPGLLAGLPPRAADDSAPSGPAEPSGSAPRATSVVPSARASRLDRAEHPGIAALQRGVLLPQPAALGQQHEHADQEDENPRPRDPWDGEHEPDHDEGERYRPPHYSLYQVEHWMVLARIVDESAGGTQAPPRGLELSIRGRVRVALVRPDGVFPEADLTARAEE